jgi:hypothetical protein
MPDDWPFTITRPMSDPLPAYDGESGSSGLSRGASSTHPTAMNKRGKKMNQCAIVLQFREKTDNSKAV